MKFPKNNGADRAGITSETPEVVLYFLQQVFHNRILSRRPFVRPTLLFRVAAIVAKSSQASLFLCLMLFERWEECA